MDTIIVLVTSLNQNPCPFCFYDSMLVSLSLITGPILTLNVSSPNSCPVKHRSLLHLLLIHIHPLDPLAIITLPCHILIDPNIALFPSQLENWDFIWKTKSWQRWTRQSSQSHLSKMYWHVLVRIYIITQKWTFTLESTMVLSLVWGEGVVQSPSEM